MRVVIDPNELSAAAKTLEQCAHEVADIGSQLAGCVSCPMPPVVAGDVDALIAKADALLDQAGVVFINQATGLVGRAIIAVLDSLAAATGVTPVSAMGVIGGGSSSGMTITNVDGSPAVGLYGMGGVVGGGSIPSGVTITNIDGSPAVGVQEIGVIGGGSGSSGITITNIDGSPAVGVQEIGVIGGSWSPDQGTDYNYPPSVVSIPTPIGSPSGPPRSTNQTFIDRITANTLNTPVLRGISETMQLIQRNSPISGLPPVERHQLPA